MSKFTVDRRPHGWLVFGSVPLDAFNGLAAMAPKGAIIDPGIANHYRANLCFADPEEAKLWRAEIEDSLKNESPEVRWLRGVHVGISSKTIFVALTKNEALQREAGQGPWGHPHDAGDFSRCHRLLKMIPEWVERLPEVGRMFPHTAWAKLAPRWAELTDDFEAGRLDEVTNKIRAIIK